MLIKQMISQCLPTKFISARNISEVSQLLTSYGDRALILAGGTLIHSLATRGILGQVELLIDISDLGLNYVKMSEDILKIGATTKFYEIEKDKEIMNRAGLSALREALSFPPPQIQSVATIGGSVASAFPLFDTPIALLALQASVGVVDSNQRRVIELDSLYKDFFQTILGRGEFIAEIILPLKGKTESAFLKLETNANDLAIVNIASSVTLDSLNRCKEVRIFFGGGVGSVPIRAVSVESKLLGKTLDQNSIEEASQEITREVGMVSDHRASAEYRVRVSKVLIKRALTRIRDRLIRDNL